ncbi:MAG: hypothetical protein HOY79_08120 [Streptomyces sp.]|nr:hypothetical protein [Streptomyces sp.]
MTRTWFPLSTAFPKLPPIQDVAIREDAAWPLVWLAGKDGTLWNFATPIGESGPAQVAAPDAVSTMDVALDDGLWVLTVRGSLWARRSSGMWSHVPPPAGDEPLIDIAINRGSVWVVRHDGTMCTLDGKNWTKMSAPASFRSIEALNTLGSVWGIDEGGELYSQNRTGQWNLATFTGHDESWADLSVCNDGTCWLIDVNGLVFNTPDGKNFNQCDGAGFAHIAAAAYQNHVGVKADGTLWDYEPTLQSSTPDPHLPTPPPPPTRPQISVTTESSGTRTIFTVWGTEFVDNVQVTIRGVKTGTDSGSEYYWTAESNDYGYMAQDIESPGSPGDRIDFSANDGRPDPSDPMSRFWSNTITAS